MSNHFVYTAFETVVEEGATIDERAAFDEDIFSSSYICSPFLLVLHNPIIMEIKINLYLLGSM